LTSAGTARKCSSAYVSLHANEVISAEQIIDALWGETAPATARKALQVSVSRLRQILGAGVLETRAPGYLIRVQDGELDLQRFERLVAQGKQMLATGDPGRAAVLLRNALTLWRGPALVDVMYESFAQGEAGQLEELRLSCLEERIEADLALGRHADLVGELKVLIDRHPYRERLCGRLMLALYRSGRQAEALGLYRRSRDRWVDDLGIEPGPELRSLASRILNQDSSLAWAPRPTSSGEVTEPTGAFVGRERSPSCWSWRTCTRRMSRLFCSCVSLRGLSPTRACWSLRQHAAATVQRLSRSPTPWRTWREPNVSATFAADGDHGAGRCRGRGRQPRAGQDAL
jgi:DNA-binding SARP family transcriptional activator